MYIIWAIVLISIAFVAYMGFHNPITFRVEVLKEVYFVYRQYVGEYRKVGPIFSDQIPKDKRAHFPKAITAGIYYDSPMEVADKNTTRAVLGFLVTTPFKQQIDDFLKEHSEYQCKLLPEVDAVRHSMVWRNMLTFIWAGFKIYPAMYNYIETKKLRPASMRTGTMEIYNHHTSPKTIDWITPISESGRQYFLTTAPEPVLKGQAKKNI